MVYASGYYCVSVLNEVLSLNAQEFECASDSSRHYGILNEVLSLNAQEYLVDEPCRQREDDSSMKS